MLSVDAKKIFLSGYGNVKPEAMKRKLISIEEAIVKKNYNHLRQT